MRQPVDAVRVRALAERLGRIAPAGTRAYLTGGATAVLEGWRQGTVDVDIRVEPDSDVLLREIPRIKEELDINIEFASPPDFLPELPGWRERSIFVLRSGGLDLYQFDPYSQALSKVERGFDTDLDDVQAMMESGLIDPARAIEFYDQIEPELYRFPAIDPADLRRRVEAIFG